MPEFNSIEKLLQHQLKLEVAPNTDPLVRQTSINNAIAALDAVDDGSQTVNATVHAFAAAANLNDTIMNAINQVGASINLTAIAAGNHVNPLVGVAGNADAIEAARIINAGQAAAAAAALVGPPATAAAAAALAAAAARQAAINANASGAVVAAAGIIAAARAAAIHGGGTAADVAAAVNVAAALPATHLPPANNQPFVRIIYVAGQFYVENKVAGYQFNPPNAVSLARENNDLAKLVDLTNYRGGQAFTDTFDYTNALVAGAQMPLPPPNGRYWDLTPQQYLELTQGNAAAAKPYHYSNVNAPAVGAGHLAQQFHPVVEQDWDTMATNLGNNQRWWMLGCLMFLQEPLSDEIATGAATSAGISLGVLFPIFLGAIGAVADYLAQVRRYKEMYNQDPPDYVKERFKENAVATFWKMSMTMTGTLVGMVFLQNNDVLNNLFIPFFEGILNAFGVASIGPATHLAGMLAVGLTVGLFLATTTILTQVYYDCKRDETAGRSPSAKIWESLKNINWGHMFKVFSYGILIGVLFYAINVLPGGQKLFGHAFDHSIHQIVNVIGSAFLTGLAITSVLKLANPKSKDMWTEFKRTELNDVKQNLKPTFPVAQEAIDRVKGGPTVVAADRMMVR